jgi:hypothetical protein
MSIKKCIILRKWYKVFQQAHKKQEAIVMLKKNIPAMEISQVSYENGLISACSELPFKS